MPVDRQTPDAQSTTPAGAPPYTNAAEDRPPDDLLRRLDQLSQLMDAQFRVPGTNWRFGVDPLLGLFPGGGDLAGAVVSMYIVLSATRYPLPRITLLRMTLNLLIDSLLGSLPLVGDLFDAWWKANRRNVRLLSQAAQPGLTARRRVWSDWAFVVLVLLLLIATVAVGLLVTFLLARLVFEALGALFS